jgi:hypothetical protein
MLMEEIENASPQEQLEAVQQVVQSAEPAAKKEVASAVVDALSHAQQKDVVQGVVAGASDSDAQKEVAAAAVDALAPGDRKDLIKSMFPSDSKDKRWVYITGFAVAGFVAIGLSLVAWGAANSTNGVSTAMLVLATGFTSAILGGLLGAYVQN